MGKFDPFWGEECPDEPHRIQSGMQYLKELGERLDWEEADRKRRNAVNDPETYNGSVERDEDDEEVEYLYGGW